MKSFFLIRQAQKLSLSQLFRDSEQRLEFTKWSGCFIFSTLFLQTLQAENHKAVHRNKTPVLKANTLLKPHRIMTDPEISIFKGGKSNL